MSDVIDAVRKKYPVYNDVPDEELVLSLGSKYPVYLDQSASFNEEFKKARLHAAAKENDAHPAAAADLSPVQLTPEQQLRKTSQEIYGAPDAEQAGSSDFLKAIASDPKGFLKSLPGTAGALLSAPGRLIYYQAADAISKLFNDPQYGGNIAAMEQGGDVAPVDAFVAQAARTNPNLAVAAKLGQSATELAPTLGLAAAPATVNRLLAAGFSASMIAHAPGLFQAYADEINKPEAEQDPGKLAELKSSILQTFLFAPLAGWGATRGTPMGETAARELNRAVDATDLGNVDVAAREGAQPLVQLTERPAPPVFEKAQPATAAPTIPTQARSLLTTVPKQTLGELDGKLSRWKGYTGYIQLDEAGRPVLWSSGRMIELPGNAETPASEIGLEIFQHERKLPAAKAEPGPETAAVAELPTEVSRQDLHENLQLLGSVVGDLRKQLQRDAFKPDPTASNLIDVVHAISQAKAPGLNHLYGALEAVPVVKRQLNGIIGRLEREGRNNEAEAWYQKLGQIEDFENKYLDVVTTPAKVRGRATTADILGQAKRSKAAPAARAAVGDEGANAAEQPKQQAQQAEQQPAAAPEQRPPVEVSKANASSVEKAPTVSMASKPVAAQNIIELRNAIAEGKPLVGVFASDGNDVYYSPHDWKDPGYAVQNTSRVAPGKWIKVNRGFLGNVSSAEVTAHREVAEMLGYKDMPGYPGEWMKAGDLEPRTAESIQQARSTVAAQQAKENEAVKFLEQKSKEWRQEWVDHINKGHYVPVEAAKTFKLEPELQSSGYVKGEFFYEKPVAKAPRMEAMGGGAVRTQIRATEQASEPGLAAAAEELNQGATESRSTREPRMEGMGSSPRSKVQGLKSAAGAATPINGLQKGAGLLQSPNPLAPGRAMQLIVRAYLGKEYGQMRALDHAFLKFKRYFDKSPKPRNYVYQPGDELAGKMPKGWQVQWAIDSGNTKSLTPAEQQFAKAYRAAMDWAIGVVQEVSPESLRDLYQNYFGRIWKDPEKNANTIRSWINSRPLEGNKSFLKERVLKDWIDGIQMGLEPLSDNPVDMMLYKVGEMVQFAGARMMKQEAKVLGLRKFFYLGEKMPDGWRVDPDPRGEVFAPPVVTIQEAFDAQVRAKTLEMFQKLGIPHERLAKLGGQRWGDAREGSGANRAGERVRTKFGGPDFVFWHEFGHIMDFRYPDLRQTLGLTKSLRTATDRELAALADLRGARQQYARKAEEKMANVFDAYIRAPDLFRQTAPTVWNNLQTWLNAHPEVKGPLSEIRPSLKIESGTTELQLAGPVLLGHWGMPEAAARVMENFQGKSLLANRKAVAGLRAVNGLLTSARLFGFFHGGMVTNDSFYGGLSLILNDALKGKFSPTEAAKNLLMVPRAFRLGGAIRQGIEGVQSRRGTLFTSEVNAVNREFGKLALEANLRSHIGTYDMSMGRRWQRAFHELMATPSTGAAWELFWRAPFAAMALTMKPVMDGLVPRMKYGMNGLQTMRVLQDLPPVRELAADELFERGVPPKDKAAYRALIQQDLQQRLLLRDQLAKSADSVEDRIGQVTYDNLFLNKTLKDASTLSLTAFGWHVTKYRGVLGATADWARAAAAVARGQKPEITFRMTYLPAMVMGHAIIGGILHYALTGRRPQSAQDLLFPESGLVDAYGNPIRLAIADYVKDIAGDINAFRFHGLHGEADRQVARLAPAWNMAAEMYRNKDFWGNQIFSQPLPQEPETEHLLKNLGEGVKYLAGSSAPFTARTGSKLQEAGAGTFASYAAPFIGVVPAPRDATMTPSQALADEIMAARQPQGGRTPDQAKRAEAIGQLVRDTRTGKINDAGDFQARARAAGVTSKQQETAIKQRVLWTPYQRSVWLMSLDDAMRVWDLANEQEKLQLVKFRPGSREGLAQKVENAAKSGRLDAATAQRYVALLLPYWQKASAAEVQGAK